MEKHKLVCGWKYDPRIDSFVWETHCKTCRWHGRLSIFAEKFADKAEEEIPKILVEIHEIEDRGIREFDLRCYPYEVEHFFSWDGTAEEIIEPYLRKIKKKEEG